MADVTDRSPREWTSLCNNVKQNIPSIIGEHAWEVITAAILVASPEPQLLGEFYSHLVQNDPLYGTEEKQKRLSLRFRDVVLKAIVLVGAPQAICALIPLAKAEGQPEEKAQSSTLGSKWQGVDVAAVQARGTQTIDTVYGDLLPKVFQDWGSHTQDMQFHILFTVYGLFLSNPETMTPTETEALVFATICCIGLKGPSLWHMRGMGRLLGARGSDETSQKIGEVKDALRSLKVGVMGVVEWVGEEYVRRADLSSWVNVGDVVRELGGWGDD